MCGRFSYRLTWREIVALYQRPPTEEQNDMPVFRLDPVVDWLDAVMGSEQAQRSLLDYSAR